MGSCLCGAGASSVPCAPASSSGGTKGKSSSRNRQMRRNSSFESKVEMWLHQIPGRMFLNGSSDAASLFTKQGKKGANQDAMIVWENFGSKADTTFCGVFDGHGPFGHMVAKKVRDSLPLKLSAQWELKVSSPDGFSDISRSAMGSMNSEEPYIKTIEDLKTFPNCEHSESHILTLKESFLKAFKVMDKELKLHPQIDCYCSGTTAVTLVKQGHDLLIGNVGDSRAVLGTRDENNSLIAVQLTVDLKPDLPREFERIRLCRGRVFALQNEPEVARVWLPYCDSPGLAMARALGDFCLKDFGLISVPEIFYRRLTDMDEFVVLATDGIWDVLSNEEVVDIVASAPRSSAARTLVESAVRAWRLKYPYAKVDDCAVICLFVDSNSSNYATSQSASEEQMVSPQENP
ncbi:probable protein phosphatase 2C 33 [Syzygium oleosum]|uniref:probable protein phosphatase 2C 33 n=1 Tax=Syzygium oleosum TaxID=219896 RepID=UPI0011D1E868|nr:probable protein phosphatase 2C 33 [Syzygium oleosum]XP_056165931.1 probable protein phosphatase 2C 33 [Syzygium oleosum]